MTDTAELVRVLREQAKKNSAKIFLPVDVYPEWQAAAALEATQARADKLEAELAEAKRALDDALSERDACHTVMRDFRETIQPVIPNARLMFFFSIAEEILAQHQSAEASLAAAKERLATLRNEVLEEAAKIADDWLEQWVDVKISHVPPHAYAADAIRDLRDGIRALKTAGKE